MGHNGNTVSYIAFPHYLPVDDITMVVLANTGSDAAKAWEMIQQIVAVVSPKNPWTDLPKE